jgi:hypothetical protein
MGHSLAFAWWDAFWLPLLMTIFVGGGVGLYISRVLGYQQTIATATCMTFELGAISFQFEYTDAARDCRLITSRIRACAIDLLLQGHVEAAAKLSNIVNKMETEIGGVLVQNAEHFRGNNSDIKEMRRIEDLINQIYSKGARDLARVQSPWWRFFRLRQSTPTAPPS